MTDYIRRADAIEAVASITMSIHLSDVICDKLLALPSADAVDCTDFINWLTEEVMDEEMWELNAVAYGEIICRKLVKLGVLETTEEPSYYIRPSADAVHGEWHQISPARIYECSICNHNVLTDYIDTYNYCPNCGARMKGGAE